MYLVFKFPAYHLRLKYVPSFFFLTLGWECLGLGLQPRRSLPASYLFRGDGTSQNLHWFGTVNFTNIFLFDNFSQKSQKVLWFRLWFLYLMIIWPFAAVDTKLACKIWFRASTSPPLWIWSSMAGSFSFQTWRPRLSTWVSFILTYAVSKGNGASLRFQVVTFYLEQPLVQGFAKYVPLTPFVRPAEFLIQIYEIFIFNVKIISVVRNGHFFKLLADQKICHVNSRV